MAALGGSSWVLAHGHSVHFSLHATMATKKLKEVSGTKPEETAATDAAPAAKRLPLKTLRVDDCSASIWGRDQMVRGEMRSFFSVTFERSYKDRDGAWKYTRSFDGDSLGKLVTLCQQASEAIESLRDQVGS
ncbi:MAG: hypothetical protein GXY83_19005 [Rhodopirellula sp.]|nr:hypothetical protein [Rhodopirellula sp.]